MIATNKELMEPIQSSHVVDFGSNEDMPLVSPQSDIGEAFDFDNVDWEHLSDHNARPLLTAKVGHLERENISLRASLQKTEQMLQHAQTQLDQTQQNDRNRLMNLCLVMREATYSTYADDYLKEFETNAPQATDFLSQSTGAIKTSEEATEIVIQSLMENIRVLSHKNELLNQDNLRLYEAAHDLEGENQAQECKIQVLQDQFKTINATRQKVVSRLVRAPQLRT